MQRSGMVLGDVPVRFNRGFSPIGTDEKIYGSVKIREDPRLFFCFEGCVVPADLGGAQWEANP